MSNCSTCKNYWCSVPAKQVFTKADQSDRSKPMRSDTVVVWQCHTGVETLMSLLGSLPMVRMKNLHFVALLILLALIFNKCDCAGSVYLKCFGGILNIAMPSKQLGMLILVFIGSYRLCRCEAVGVSRKNPSRGRFWYLFFPR